MKLKRFVEQINQHLSLIILTPAILGGLWQVIELSRISFSFIRFFSVSQIIPDGLLILLFIIMFIISIFILIHILKRNEKKEEKESMDENKIEKSDLKISVSLILISLVVFVLIIYLNLKFIVNIDSIWTILLYFPTNIILSLFAYGLIIEAENYAKGNNVLKYSDLISSSISIFYVSIQFVTFLIFLSQFHTDFMLPTELKNIDNLNCKIELMAPKTKFEILYLNDKYIFIKLFKKSKDRYGRITKTSTMILNFEEIMNDESCKEKKNLNNEIKFERRLDNLDKTIDSITNTKLKKFDSLKGVGKGAVIPDKGP